MNKRKAIRSEGAWVVVEIDILTERYETQAEAITEAAQQIVQDKLKWFDEWQMEEYGNKIQEAATEYIKSYLVPQNPCAAREEREIDFGYFNSYISGFYDGLKKQ